MNHDLYILTPELLEKVADLKVKALIFDMDVDIETLTLVPKSTYKEPSWIARWKEKQHDEDFDTQFDIDAA